MRGGGSKAVWNFPKIHPFWRYGASHREGVQKETFFGGRFLPNVGGVADSQTRSKPLKTPQNHPENRLFRPKFHLSFVQIFFLDAFPYQEVSMLEITDFFDLLTEQDETLLHLSAPLHSLPGQSGRRPRVHDQQREALRRRRLLLRQWARLVLLLRQEALRGNGGGLSFKMPTRRTRRHP